MSLLQKSLITTLVIGAAIIGWSVFSDNPFSDTVFPWLVENNLTKYTQVSDFRPRDTITRGEAAKFVTEYAWVIGIEKVGGSCEFSDTQSYDPSLTPYTIESCEYGLFRGADGRFMPSSPITEAQALAVVVRSLYGIQDESMKPWYREYYSIAKDLDIISSESIASMEKSNITREKLGTWLYRAAQTDPNAPINDAIVYETEVSSADECSSYETYDSDKQVCSYECKTEVECKDIQSQIDREFASLEEALTDTGRTIPDAKPSDTEKWSKVLYSVSQWEQIRVKRWTDTSSYQGLWKEVADLSPDSLSDSYINEFEVYSDSTTDTLAFVINNDAWKWKMAINLATHGESDPKEQKLTFIHELMHIISLNAGQMMTPKWKCPNYQADEGCTKSTAYLANFVKKYWGTSKTWVYSENNFVSEYAMTNPEEDIAESFSAFVLAKSFSDATVAEQKKNFFNGYPELIQMRQDMRSVIAEEIIRARKK